jgi:hypothetical protein
MGAYFVAGFWIGFAVALVAAILAVELWLAHVRKGDDAPRN